MVYPLAESLAIVGVQSIFPPFVYIHRYILVLGIWQLEDEFIESVCLLLNGTQKLL